MTPVKDQGMCGSCWAFATVAMLEGLISIFDESDNGGLYNLSEQQLIDCTLDHSLDHWGVLDACGGGDHYAGANYYAMCGVNRQFRPMLASDYPYTSGTTRR